MREVWKDIYFVDKGITYDYRGIYQVSNWGRIKSLERIVKNNTGHRKIKEKIRNITKDKYGYLQITLYKNNKQKTFRIHRIVAILFVDNPDNLPEVNHKDKDPENCFASNLEWCTTLYNIQYSLAKKVLQCDLQGNLIKEWNCIRDAERQLNINQSNIAKCCKAKYGFKTAGGYIWRYKD